jgi:raffinose/stachyose/melibiose transport system substrate-binding protein
MTELKKISIVALALLMVASLSFAQGAKDQAAASGQTELTVLYYIDMSAPNSADEIEKVWDRFSAENPDIKVIREDLFNEPFHQKTEAYVASGNLPDVVYMWPGGRSTSLQTTHSVKDLMPFLEKDGLVGSYAPAALAPQAAGYLAELPNGITSSHMMFANTRVLKENGLSMPKTMNDLIAMVPVLKSKGIEVIGMDNMDSWVMQSCLFSLVVGRMGGADWYERLDAGQINFADPWFVDSLKVIDTLYKEGVINRNTLNSAYGNGRGNFAAGKAAFFIDGDWACANFQTDSSTGKALISPEAQASDIELVVFPEIPGEVIHNTTSGVVGTGFGMSASIPAGSAKEEAAWRLIKYLQGTYVQTYRLTVGSSFPSNLNVDVEKVIKDNNLEPLVGKRAAFYQQYGTTPVIDGVLHSDVFNVINTGLQEIGLGSKTPAQVAADVQKAWVAFKAGN